MNSEISVVCQGMTGKVSSNSCICIVLNVKKMTLEPVYDYVPGLTNIFCIADVVFKVVNEIIALTFDLHYNDVFGTVMQVD